ncbi:MAG: hypothetical protein JO286_06025 [Solirubrobacterales bacterium]|nr:hypothetical protein [Solirubrobacterales bacterium]MBV9364555.1 hypothetical protein [Solirubrobacterales bacterium]MBV9806719.1 hypothetical protein [Solirubrobacterales bacterium]
MQIAFDPALGLLGVDRASPTRLKRLDPLCHLGTTQGREQHRPSPSVMMAKRAQHVPERS